MARRFPLVSTTASLLMATAHAQDPDDGVEDPAPVGFDSSFCLTFQAAAGFDLPHEATVDFVVEVPELVLDEETAPDDPDEIVQPPPLGGCVLSWGTPRSPGLQVSITPDRRLLVIERDGQRSEVRVNFDDGELHHIALVGYGDLTEVVELRAERFKIEPNERGNPVITKVRGPRSLDLVPIPLGSPGETVLHLGSAYGEPRGEDGEDEYFIGYVHSVRLWDRALGLDELAAMPIIGPVREGQPGFDELTAFSLFTERRRLVLPTRKFPQALDAYGAFGGSPTLAAVPPDLEARGCELVGFDVLEGPEALASIEPVVRAPDGSTGSVAELRLEMQSALLEEARAQAAEALVLLRGSPSMFDTPPGDLSNGTALFEFLEAYSRRSDGASRHPDVQHVGRLALLQARLQGVDALRRELEARSARHAALGGASTFLLDDRADPEVLVGLLGTFDTELRTLRFLTNHRLSPVFGARAGGQVFRFDSSEERHVVGLSTFGLGDGLLAVAPVLDDLPFPSRELVWAEHHPLSPPTDFLGLFVPDTANTEPLLHDAEVVDRTYERPDGLAPAHGHFGFRSGDGIVDHYPIYALRQDVYTKDLLLFSDPPDEQGRQQWRLSHAGGKRFEGDGRVLYFKPGGELDVDGVSCVAPGPSPVVSALEAQREEGLPESHDKLEWDSIFGAHDRPPQVAANFKGYDVFALDPREYQSSTGVPGSVFEQPGPRSRDYYFSDRIPGLIVPYGMIAVSEIAGDETVRTEVASSASDFLASWNTTTGADLGIKQVFSFAKNKTLQTQVRNMVESERAYTITRLRQFELAMVLDKSRVRLNEHFAQHVDELAMRVAALDDRLSEPSPAASPVDPSLLAAVGATPASVGPVPPPALPDLTPGELGEARAADFRARYDRLFGHFGNHYTFAVTYGSMFCQERDFSREAYGFLVGSGRGESMKLSHETSMSLDLGGVAKAEVGKNVGVTSGSEEEQIARFNQAMSEEEDRVFALGGSLSRGGWSPVRGQEVPLLLDLRPIDELLSPLYFPDPLVWRHLHEELRARLVEQEEELEWPGLEQDFLPRVVQVRSFLVNLPLRDLPTNALHRFRGFTVTRTLDRYIDAQMLQRGGVDPLLVENELRQSVERAGFDFDVTPDHEEDSRGFLEKTWDDFISVFDSADPDDPTKKISQAGQPGAIFGSIEVFATVPLEIDEPSSQFSKAFSLRIDPLPGSSKPFLWKQDVPRANRGIVAAGKHTYLVDADQMAPDPDGTGHRGLSYDIKFQFDTAPLLALGLFASGFETTHSVRFGDHDFERGLPHVELLTPSDFTDFFSSTANPLLRELAEKRDQVRNEQLTPDELRQRLAALEAEYNTKFRDRFGDITMVALVVYLDDITPDASLRSR